MMIRTKLFVATALGAVTLFAQIPDSLKGPERGLYILENVARLPEGAFERFLEQEIAEGRLRPDSRNGVLSAAKLLVQAKLDFEFRYRQGLPAAASANGKAVPAALEPKTETIAHNGTDGTTGFLQLDVSKNRASPSDTYGNPLLRPVPGGVTYAPNGIRRRDEPEPLAVRQSILRRAWNVMK